MATYSLVNKGPEYAQVTDVQPIKQQVKTPREVCKDVAVTRQAPVKDQHQIAGTVVGALAGGLLGNQIGGGTGRTLATIAGAVGGGYAGNEVEKNVRSTTSYVVDVRMENGKTRSFPQTSENWRAGDQVRVVNGRLEGRG